MVIYSILESIENWKINSRSHSVLKRKIGPVQYTPKLKIDERMYYTSSVIR